MSQEHIHTYQLLFLECRQIAKDGTHLFGVHVYTVCPYKLVLSFVEVPRLTLHHDLLPSPLQLFTSPAYSHTYCNSMSEKEEKSAASRSSKADPAERLSDTGSGAGPSDGESNSSATVLIPHDVLLGRGSGCNDYEGNVMFRSLVEERKREYLSAVTTREDKNRIAQEIFDQITMNGGRFLKKEDKGKMNGAIVNKGVYVQVHPGVALEKVKQALRQRWQNRRQQVTQVYNTGATNEILSHDDDRSRDQSLPQPPFDTLPEVASASICSAIQGFGCPQVNHFSYLSDPFQSTLFRSTVNPASACAQLLLFQRAQKALHQQPTLLRSLSLQQSLEQLAATSSTDQLSTVSQNWDQSDNLSRPSTNTSSLHASGGHPLLNGTIRSFPRQTGLVVPEKITQDSLLHAESSQGKKPTKESLESSVSEDALVALDALSTLSMTGRPKFTDQQRSEELALLSDEERLQALMDKFGRLYIGDRQTKKPRRDINQLSISFLVSQMKLELDRIPDVEKLAMLEANAKCRLYEFSDARLIQFLRSGGMNVKVRYNVNVIFVSEG